MAHQPDVQKHQQHQEEQQRLQELQNIVYIHQGHQDYRNQSYQFQLEDQNNLIGNQIFQSQNVSFGQFENHCPFVSNGQFSPSNSSTTIIQQDKNRNKNFPPHFKSNTFNSDSRNSYQRNDGTFQITTANYQNLNYQQSSQFFLPNIRNQYQLNDVLLPAYQSSNSSESSDESSISNISQSQYSNESNGVLNNQFEFQAPISTINQSNKTFQQFQQKEFLENYGSLLHQESQIPRCDSSKSETAESTCSSLSSGSTESQSENENLVQVPVLVNPLLNNNGNCNILHSYQTNTHNNISAYSNQIHHDANGTISQRPYRPEQNFNGVYGGAADTSNGAANGLNNMLPSNNQMNNLVVMLPTHAKNIQNCLMTNQPILKNPSSTDLSKIVIQNQKGNQQKIYSFISISNQASQGKTNAKIQLNEDLNLKKKNIVEGHSENDTSIMKNDEKCVKTVDKGNINNSNINNTNGKNTDNMIIEKNDANNIIGSNYNCSSGKLVVVEKNSREKYVLSDDISASQIHNTSDSSVINSSFIENKHATIPVGNESSAMLSNETSDNHVRQCISDVNNSLVNSNNVFLVKNDEKNEKSIFFDESSVSTTASNCLTNSAVNAFPVPVGWKRLLIDDSVIYLSPTNTALSSIEQVKLYLQTVGTCKCGLECPVHCDSVFNFNPKVISRPWDSSDTELTRLCNHKRKASVPVSSVLGDDRNFKLNKKELLPTKRKKKKHGSNSSGVSVSQLIAQRDRALAAAAARWSMNTRPRTFNFSNVPSNQFQNVQVVRNPAQGCPQISYENNNQSTDIFLPEASPTQLVDIKNKQFSCINVVNNAEKEGTVLNLNGMGQLLPENRSSDNELLRPQLSNLNTVMNQGQTLGPRIINTDISYTQTKPEFVQNELMDSRPQGLILTPQEMVLPPNMIKPRSIPPWHQTKMNLNKKHVPETSVTYDRIPCIQQHMPPPPTLIFDDPNSRRKYKTNSKTKKTLQESFQNQPSFMENPSAYLAQQTALLHSTISLPNFVGNSDNRTATSFPQNIGAISTIVNDPNVTPHSDIVLPSSKNNTFGMQPLIEPNQVNQSDFTLSQEYSKNVLEKAVADSGETLVGENSNQTFRDFIFGNHICSNTNCLECKKSKKIDDQDVKEKLNENGVKDEIKFIQNSLEKSQFGIVNKRRCDKTECKGGIGEQKPLLKHDQNNVEESPVTSSTEKSPSVFNQKIICDSRPIQGGTISTSNGSPQPSPKSSSIFRQEVSSPKCSESAYPNTITSSKSCFVMANGICSSAARDNESGLTQFKLGNMPNKTVSQNLPSFSNCHQRLESPDGSQGYKISNSNFIGIKTYNQKSQQNLENSEDQIKGQSVSSTLDIKKEKNNEIKGNRIVQTMASGHTVSSNTITSVQAGKTQTATVTVNSSSPISPTTISLVNFSNQTNVSIPFSQKGNVKTPLEMVQSVVSSIQTSPPSIKNELQHNIVAINKPVLPTSSVLNNILTTTASITTSMLPNNSNTASVLKTSPGGLQAGHILVSNNGQYIMASSGNVIPQSNISGLKINPTNSLPSMNAPPIVTNVTGTVTQVLPTVGVAQQVLGQPTVLVNALPAPFVIQPGVMAVDTGLGRLAVATGNVLQSSLIENNSLRNSVRGLASPEKVRNRKGNKKRKTQVAPVVQMASPNNVIFNQSFNQQNFALSPGGNVQPLQALTFVQGKHGGAAQIMMNNQNNFNQFSPQPQQINLLQPVNLTSVSNFPAFQQFIVPSLGNMVMSTDGTTTILPDTNLGVQLQLQNVNGQNVLTPVQNTGFINGQGILTAPTGMLIRAPSSQQKIIQNNSSSQFLSPNNGQFLVNQFQGQLSPLIAANLSPNQQIFTSSPPRQSPQEYIQIIPTSSSQNTTVVQQNTTIVQQQTTMVSNNQNIIGGSGKSSFILNNPSVEKPVELQFVNASQRQNQPTQVQPIPIQRPRCSTQDTNEMGHHHSVSTQTMINKEPNNIGIATNNSFCQTLTSTWTGSPPDTTTHSPIQSESSQERALSPLKPEDCLAQAMVQYVSSSMNENENESETYLLPGITKLLTNCDVLQKQNEKAKNIVESSTVLQESGIQIRIGGGYVSSRHLNDERVVSSHSDINLQDDQLESNITSYQDDKTKLFNALLPETRPDNLDEEKITESKDKFSEGDLVWGSVRGSLAWPGKLIGPINSEGRALVRWFGGHGLPTRVNVSQLQSLSQGLEAHHKASNKGRKNRKLNIELEAAIQEAMLELDKMTAQEKKNVSGSGRPRRSNR